MSKIMMRKMKDNQSGIISAVKVGGELGRLVFQIGSAIGILEG